MKIAITGKGGVGKTFIASTLMRLFEKKGFKVIGVDCDPNPTLALSFGIEDTLIPLSKRHDIIEERTGAKPGTYGSIFKLNPKVDDLIDKVGYKIGNITILVMGTIEEGGEGCVCPASVLLRRLLRHLIVKRDEVVILDMEAGIEHFGRKTIEDVDLMLIVIEPTKKSLITAKRMKKLANDLGIKNIKVIINKVRNEDKELLKNIVEKELGLEILGFVPYDENVIEGEFLGKPINLDSKSTKEIEKIFNRILELKKNI
ncbi:CO dehydrogenase accessory protein CooC (nickel insertion) [Methanocaldococcus lauensis]|uniref:CO dehydrogenase accessory protein CooC (Nickel insertion) n=1 Tax=Methanocaldococcus lauensis TaxID=2546128 RepID=A0A8D6PPM4_9EURY|nr:ArsA-related P-loop ATPase [Methanocaldococcus lauensis]CAB3287644.1 CO dehydrogenase accessory protein CooC (nickel insertion) [Methanocaldococcus lauensis]